MRDCKTLGVVIGRFQTFALHEGHRALIDYAVSHSDRLLVLVGCTNIRFTGDNPLPSIVMPLYDSSIDNHDWSLSVDQRVQGVLRKGERAALYGSRDSFIPKYSGVFPTRYTPEVGDCSATQMREAVAREWIDDPVFRRGWIAAIHGQYAITDPTVDVVIHTTDWRRILLGRRGPGAPLRFIGGFVNKDDPSYEVAACREQTEEVLGIEVCAPEYITSLRIQDPRYARSTYGIVTTLFGMEYKSGEAVAGDDMGIVEWCDFNESLLPHISPEHMELFKILLQRKECN